MIEIDTEALDEMRRAAYATEYERLSDRPYRIQQMRMDLFHFFAKETDAECRKVFQEERERLDEEAMALRRALHGMFGSPKEVVYEMRGCEVREWKYT